MTLLRSALPRALPRTLRQTRLYSSYESNLVGFTEGELELQSAVRDFAKREIAPIAAALDKANEFPMHLWSVPARMRSNGASIDGFP